LLVRSQHEVEEPALQVDAARLERTDHAAARWHVVAAEDKRWARVDVIRTVCEEIERALTARGIDPDPPLPGSADR